MDELALFNYQSVFTNLVDVSVMLDLNNQKVAWMSERFSNNYPQVQVGSSSYELCRMIGKDPDTIDKVTNKLCFCNSSAYKIDKVICKDNVIEICNVGDSVVVIRLQPNQNSNLAQTRYLEDREKLLFTSRSITVSEMASTLAHEINQPVGTISNLLYGIRSRLSVKESIDDDIFNAIDKSLEQTKYTSDIITRIRDYTRSREPKLNLVKISELIDKCISLMDWEIRYTNVEIKHRNMHSPTVYGDELMLQQVIVNLIRNGMDANSESEDIDNTIRIITTVNDNHAEISIIDNGKGLTDQEAKNIFIPFASNKSTGMGIGLNICRSFIELHNGKLWLTRNEERGCTSHITLPLNNLGK